MNKKGKVIIINLFMQIVGFIIGVVPQLRSLMIGSNAPLHVIEDSTSMLGYVSQIFNFKILELHKVQKNQGPCSLTLFNY